MKEELNRMIIKSPETFLICGVIMGVGGFIIPSLLLSVVLLIPGGYFIGASLAALNSK